MVTRFSQSGPLKLCRGLLDWTALAIPRSQVRSPPFPQDKNESCTQSAFPKKVATCAKTLAQGHLRRPTCAEQCVLRHRHRAACVGPLRRRAACTDNFADTRRATCAEQSCAEQSCAEQSCAEQIAKSHSLARRIDRSKEHSPCHDNNLREGATEQPHSAMRVRRATCAERLARSDLPRATCSGQLAQGNLHTLQVAKGKLHRAICAKRLGQIEQLTQSNLRGEACTVFAVCFSVLEHQGCAALTQKFAPRVVCCNCKLVGTMHV